MSLIGAERTGVASNARTPVPRRGPCCCRSGHHWASSTNAIAFEAGAVLAVQRRFRASNARFHGPARCDGRQHSRVRSKAPGRPYSRVVSRRRAGLRRNARWLASADAGPKVRNGNIENRAGWVRRFQEFSAEFPWRWRPVGHRGLPRRAGGQAKRPISLTTLRSDSNSVAMFCAYIHASRLRLERLLRTHVRRHPSSDLLRLEDPQAHHRRRGPARTTCVHQAGAPEDSSTTSTTRLITTTPQGPKRWLFALPRLDRLQALLRLRTAPTRSNDARRATTSDPTRTSPAYGAFGALTGPLGQGHRRVRAHGVGQYSRSPEFDWVVPICPGGGRPSGHRGRLHDGRPLRAGLWPSERGDRPSRRDTRRLPSLPPAMPPGCQRNSASTA